MESSSTRAGGLLRIGLLAAFALIVAGVAFVACGSGSEPSAALGSPENPIPAQTQPATEGRRNEVSSTPGASPSTKPSYDKLVAGQSSRPGSRFSPCSLVSADQAQDILGAEIEAPLEAPQGPTCIYRTTAGDDFITLAVQTVDFDRLRGQIDRRERIEVGDRTAYCGFHGRAVLYAAVSDGRVLSIAGRCSVAREFATRALRRLTS
jgi:hypothetical protein